MNYIKVLWIFLLLLNSRLWTPSMWFSLESGAAALSKVFPSTPTWPSFSTLVHRIGKSCLHHCQGHPSYSSCWFSMFSGLDWRYRGFVLPSHWHDKDCPAEAHRFSLPLQGFIHQSDSGKIINSHIGVREATDSSKQPMPTATGQQGRGIFHNNTKTFLAWCGEADHLRIIYMQMGSVSTWDGIFFHFASRKW